MTNYLSKRGSSQFVCFMAKAAISLSVAVSVLSLVGAGFVGITTAVAAQPSQSPPEAVTQPEAGSGFRVFEFASMDDRGKYIHCVATVEPDSQNPGQLLPSSETCFADEAQSAEFALTGSSSALGDAIARVPRIRPNVVIGIHYDGYNQTGASITLVGVDCLGGGITLTGGRWDNRINSTANGCSRIEHYDVSRHYVFTGEREDTTGIGGNLRRLSNRVSGILYKGQFPVPSPPVTTTTQPPAPPLPQPPAPSPPTGGTRRISDKPTEVEVVAIEVTQGVQNWRNNITMVKDKPTVVRVFMQASNSIPVTAELLGKKLETKITELGPIQPENSNGQVMVTTDIASRRQNINDSLNFELPESWINIGTGHKLRLTVRFASTFRTNCSTAEIKTPAGDACTVEVTFTDVNEPSFVVLPISVNTENDPDKLSSEEIIEQMNRINSNMPFSELNYTVSAIKWPVSNNFNPEYILRGLNYIRWGKTEYHLGILPNSWNATFEDTNSRILGSAELGGRVGMWTVGDSSSGTYLADQVGYSRNTGPHEVGHILGENHPGRPNSDNNNEVEGACGELNPSDNGFRYFYNIGGVRRATLGPIGDNSLEIWGFDTRLFESRNSGDINVSDSLIVSNPREVFSLMSYCSLDPVRQNQVRWMDGFHYNRIKNNRTNPYSASSRSAVPRTIPRATMSEVISGSIKLSNTGEPTSLSIEPIFSIKTSNRLNKSGDYTLELLTSSGTVVRTISFDALHAEETCQAAPCNAENSTETVYFSILLHDIPDFKTLKFSKNSKQIAALNRSDNAPFLYLLNPVIPRTLSVSDSINLTWGATDLDNDELSFSVLYSIDGGESYDVMIYNTTEKSASFDVGILKGSNSARFAITASDGFRSAIIETSILSIPEHRPSVDMIAPKPEAYFAERQGFTLAARGYDIEDGNLLSESFKWQSDIDGNIGIGKKVILAASDLTPGDHKITVTATDSSGMQSTATTDITISLYKIVPFANNDYVSADLDAEIEIDVVLNDINIDKQEARDNLKIIEFPKLGKTEIVSSFTGINVFKYTGTTSGKDTFSYQICDALDQCSIASVYIDVAIDMCTIIGTEEDDNIIGTSGDDIICGLGGNDTIDARNGNDIIYGGVGNDKIYARGGNDIVYGGQGNDFILGHNGNDSIYGREGNDIIYGGGGDDIVAGGEGADELYGEAGSDALAGNKGSDKIHGGRGDDIIRGGDGDDTIRGNAGADMIYPGSGSNTLLGIAEEDTVIR